MVQRKRLLLLRSVAWKVKFSGSRLCWLLWTFGCLIIRQFLELKTSCFSANLWCANLFFFLFGFVRPVFLIFFVLVRFDISILIFFFSFNKITDFHFDFSFHFVFENSFSEFECAASFFY